MAVLLMEPPVDLVDEFEEVPLPPPLTTPAAVEPKSYEKIFDDAFTEVFFATHAFGGRVAVDNIQISYDDKAIAADMVSPPQALLIPKYLDRKISKIRGKFYQLFKHYCLPGDSEGRHMVSRHHSEAFVEKFEVLRVEYDAVADEIAAKWPEIREETILKWSQRITDPKAFEQAIGRWLPTDPSVVRNAYQIEFRPTNQTADLNNYKNGAIRRWFAEGYDNAQKEAEKQRRARYLLPIVTLKEAITKLRTQVARGKKVTPASFTRTLEQIDLLRACTDVMAPELVSLVNEADSQLRELLGLADSAKDDGDSYTRAIRRSEAAISNITDRLAAACDAAADTEALATRFGRLPMAIG